MIDESFLEILACPLDRKPVKRDGDWIVCTECGRKYPIEDGIPVMLIDRAVLPENAKS